MGFFWQRQALIAIRSSLSPRDRKRCFKALNRYEKNLWYWLIVMPVLVGPGVLVAGAVRFSNELLPFMVYLIAAAAWLAYSAIVTFHIGRNSVKWLVDYFMTQGVRLKFCVACGYNLRGTPDESTSCPECGAEIAAVTCDVHDVVDAG